MMELWKRKQLHASAGEVDEEGLDAENRPSLKLSIEEAIQAVKDVMEGGETVPEIPKGPEGSDQ
jgi:hypothetical protein